MVSISIQALGILKLLDSDVGRFLPRLFVVVLTCSANTTSLHLDENVIVTQFWKRNLDDGEFRRL